MAIETNNLVIYKSERLTDTSDGGGKYSGQVVEDGISNNLFNDVSDLDRTMGDVSMRKVFAGVTSQDTDSLMGATVFVSENPVDPNVSALLFSTKSWTDTRNSAQNRVENYLVKGGQAPGLPLDTHWMGMKALQVIMFPEETENSVGDTLVLVSNEGKATQNEQYVRITTAETRTAILIVNNNKIEYKIATYGLSDPLSSDFVGVSPTQWYNGSASITIIRDTLVADTGNYYASADLATDANVGEFTVQASGIYTQLIPSAQTETPLLDLNAANQNTALVAGNDGVITVSYSTNVNTGQSLYIGSIVLPGSVSMTVFGQTVNDSAGLLKTTEGTQVGTIDYQTGHIVWTNAIGSGNTTVNITFTPAANPTQPFQSHAIPVTQNNQSSNWTGVLMPIPAPGSLIVSFMAQGKFYQLKDNGAGKLEAGNTSIGTGTVNYTTGTWLVTLGALPDVGTPILLQWGSPVNTFARADLPVLPASISFDLEQEGIAANSVTVTWLLNSVTKTAVSNSAGQFTGDATGNINYANGTGLLIPKLLPQKGTSFSFAFDYGDSKTQSYSATPDDNGKITFTVGTGSSITPNSIFISVPLSSNSQGSIDLHDVPVNATTGNLVNQYGDVQGTINYTNGAVEVTPERTYTYQKLIYSNVDYATTYGTA